MEIPFIVISCIIPMILGVSAIIFMRNSSQEIIVKESFNIFDKTVFLKELKETIEKRNWSVLEESSEVIQLRTRWSWKSWGEIIIIKFNKNGSHIEITSKPRLKSTIIDYGKNQENIHLIAGVASSIK